jgi:hypothetical protein
LRWHSSGSIIERAHGLQNLFNAASARRHLLDHPHKVRHRVAVRMSRTCARVALARFLKIPMFCTRCKVILIE